MGDVMGDVMATLTRDDLCAWMARFASAVIAAQDALSDLDSAGGDADHGANLARGMAAVVDALPGMSTPVGAMCKDIGLVLVDTIGGSSGALYGTIFLRLAQTAGLSAATLDLQTLARGFQSAAQGITERGGAKPGDKTMLDALAPAVLVLGREAYRGCSLPSALSLAALAAEEGAQSTRAMQARRGKASYLGAGSVGTIDPGAKSTSMMMRCLADTASGRS